MNSFVLLVFFLFSVTDLHHQSQSVEFTFNGFNGSQSNLLLHRASIKRSGALRLTNSTQNYIGQAFYSQKIQMFNKTSPNATSFSSSFVFSIVPPASGKGGHGLVFTLSPSYPIPGAAPSHYLGLFNESNNGNSSNHLFAVEFDTVNGFNENVDTHGNHVGININGMYSKASRPASYGTINNPDKEEEIDLHKRNPVQAWVEYDGAEKFVYVTICPMNKPKPIKPLISYHVDLTQIVLENMFVGFSASTGKKASSHYILGWSFSTTGAAPELNLSVLPIPPKEKTSSSFKISVIGLIIALCVVTVILLGILFSATVYKQRRFLEFANLEDFSTIYKKLNSVSKV